MTSSRPVVSFLRIVGVLALSSFLPLRISLQAQIVGWKQIGPAPLIVNPPDGADGKGPDAGVVVDIAIDPSGTTDQVIYIAGSGGVWKTTDGGTTWKPKTDFMPTLSVGTVALDPANPSIVYAGTGNAFGNGFSESAGIYKSIDGGDSWIVLNPGGMFARTSTIQRMVLPARDLLIVATNQGLFRSIDGGQNFGANPPLFNDRQPVLTGFISDLKVDTASASTIYAAVTGSGIFKSTDSGATFPSPPFFSVASVPPATGFGFIAFAQSTRPNNQTFYANVDVGTGAASMFKSGDGGSTWTVVASNPFPGELQNFYDQTVGVDPQDANRAYFGLRALYETKDGGATGLTPANRTDLNQVHADQHALTFSPQSHWSAGGAPTRLYNGTDGGIATTANEGANWTLLNDGLATMLFYDIDIGRGSPANNQFTYGAAQDLGLSSNNRAGLTGLQWLLGSSNDGFSIAVDPLNATHAIANQNGTFTVSSTDGTAPWPTPLAIPAINSITLINNVAFDPNGARAYVVGGTFTNGNLLLQSTDNAATFSLMHVFPQILNNGGFPVTISKADSNVMWVSLTDGTLQRTSNALTGAASTWTAVNVNAPTAPNQAVAQVAIDPTNTNQVVAVYNGFSTIGSSGLATGHVFMTNDNGKSWTDISGNLPDTPLTSVIIDPTTSPHGIVVAAWGGVFRSANGGATWVPSGAGFPNAFATSLAFDANAVPPLLRAGTFGRSAWELTTLTSAPTMLTYTGATSDDYHDAATLSARLILGGTSTPVTGQTITFSVGTQSCTGVTDSTGTAACDVTLNQIPGAYIVKGSFAGAGTFQASSASLPFSITREETTLNYTGDTVIANGTTAHLSAVLLEDGVAGIAGRTVMFTLGTGSTAQRCTQVTDAAGVAACTISPVSQPFGAGAVTADFAGDVYYLPSSASAPTIIFAFLPQGAFVLGDNTAVTGAADVEFWGADWARQNVLSGGSAPDAFKGFASAVSTSPPACGDTWLSRPGNSSKPPDALPPFMGVAVSSAIRQSGSTISGNVPRIVVLHIDAGYAPDPADRGTGKIVAVYCH